MDVWEDGQSHQQVKILFFHKFVQTCLAVMAAKLPPVIESKVTLQLLPNKKVREIVPLRDYMDTNTSGHPWRIPPGTTHTHNILSLIQVTKL